MKCMKKIPTIFERDWDGDRTVIDKYTGTYDFSTALATEKIDGMNVRVTVRNHTLVRLEKRRNPDKLQKAKGIVDPWYVDADEYGPEDKYLWLAARQMRLDDVEDGEWSGEAVGPNIQGNPLNLKTPVVILFSCKADTMKLSNVPTDYDGLKAYLPTAKSVVGNNCGIEGIVWHWPNGDMAKIKTKDFEKDGRLQYEKSHGKS